MGFRFRRSVKILPGVRLNFSKSGVSTSFGGRGYTVNVGKRGITRTVGLPGTGLSITSRVATEPTNLLTQTTNGEELNLQPGRFGLPLRNRTRTIMFWLSGACALGGAAFPPLSLFAVMFLIVGLTRQSPQAMVRSELARRRAEWIAHLRSLPDPPSTDQVADAVRRLEESELTDEEGGPAATLLRAAMEVDQFTKDCGERLVPIRVEDLAVGRDACYFAGIVVYDKRGSNDETGRLVLAATRAIFFGGSVTSIPWPKVREVRRDGASLLLHRYDRQHATVFQFSQLAEAMKAEWVSKKLVGTGDSAVR
jgi:hypothetical protein